MKIPYKNTDAFVKNPGQEILCALVYGPDEGLVRERSEILCRTVTADLNDAFQVSVLTASDLESDSARFFDEAYAMSMMGGRRLVRVRGASDKFTVLLKPYLNKPNKDALIVVEAGELSPRSSLRKLVESDKAIAAAVPCYVDDARAVTNIINQTLIHAGFRIERDAAVFLSEALAGDRQRIRRELDKLITYMGPHPGYTGPEGDPAAENCGTITLEDAMACCGNGGVMELDSFVMATAGGDGAKAHKAYTRLLQEDIGFVTILRVLQNHFRRLHVVKSRTESGVPLDSAMKSLNPPVFFKQENEFRAQIGRWSLHRLQNTLMKLTELEARCKRTGAVPQTLVGQFIVSVTG